MAGPVYPFTTFNFAVEINRGEEGAPLVNAAFSECDGLEMSLEVKTIREGGGNERQIRLNGAVAYGQLTLKRISAAQLPGGSADDEAQSNDLLLWGQTDLDVETLEACLGPRPPGSAKREPIHPSVLVEVLQWNGHAQRQVLLVSSDPKAAKGRRVGSGAGVAMWVDQADQGHLAGVWCRWEVMNDGEGRWEADLVRADAPAK